eukprot:CAMPEP_0172303384 /NCGR_PEP_ID=MMETSP1058-20130122/4918_1 /TAXON_ID=83371 /ORGANISM="Detonula confervacea, Strain CCMP 353" /LENGTH=52 /DNA_ID=CAMNT_0013014169 /DNA_START=585 /DNA_END=740 /DNA_ORIENTATION=+
MEPLAGDLGLPPTQYVWEAARAMGANCAVLVWEVGDAIVGFVLRSTQCYHEA